MRRNALTLLFDLDGTMVDTDALHIAAYNRLLAPLGGSIDLEYYRRHVMGFSNDGIAVGLFPTQGAEQRAAFSALKERTFRSLIDRLEPTPGLLDVLDWADDVGCARAVVTNAPRDNAELMLRGLGLLDRFAIVIIGEELTHGKPHPLPYLTGMQRVGGQAASTIAFEDSLSGVRSASAAGVLTVGMTISLPEESLRAAGASHVATDFRDQRFSTLLRARSVPLTGPR